MKTIISLFLAAFIALSFTACTTAPVSTTPRQELLANAVEDALSVGLVPVFVKNPGYIAAAQSVALGLGSFSGSDLTPADIAAFVNRISALSDSDRKTVIALVQSCWQTYSRRYRDQVSASVRPDVRTFLDATSRGILNAIAAVPKS